MGRLTWRSRLFQGSAPFRPWRRHGIPLTQVGRSLTVTTGRQLRHGWPEGATDVVVMLDASARSGSSITTSPSTGVPILAPGTKS